MTALIRELLDFWFLPLSDPGHGGRRELWWKSTPEFDAEISARFGAAMEDAIAGRLDGWRQSPDGALALLLLTDQFPRNVWRRTARAFSGDEHARATARLALARHYPLAYGPQIRTFFYLPFEHSEAMADQELSCALFATIGTDDALKFAIDHRDIVARFGRFPHRNEALGRPSTQEEIAWLKDGARFGQ
ncbi:MAG: DUF924 domain-containing protein [Alphaproteobacteria bacterium]|nr:DUF924 domain-containing protein [Alphaproteobacteria bacterium]